MGITLEIGITRLLIDRRSLLLPAKRLRCEGRRTGSMTALRIGQKECERAGLETLWTYSPGLWSAAKAGWRPASSQYPPRPAVL